MNIYTMNVFIYKKYLHIVTVFIDFNLKYFLLYSDRVCIIYKTKYVFFFIHT